MYLFFAFQLVFYRCLFACCKVICTWNSLPDSVIEAIIVLIVSKIGLINTGITLSSNIWKADPTGPEAVVKVSVIFL